MKIRLYTKEDYPVISKWYIAHNMPPMCEALISAPSVIVSRDDDTPLLLVITYIAAGVPMATISWAIGNPDAGKREMYDAMELAIDATLYILKENGTLMVFCNLARLSRSKMLDRFGFIKGEKSIYERFLTWQPSQE